ncbi:hypothetical protein [Streptomyces sp. NPDC059783]|uniref:hypothetical protein n=1 Tax=Streptomyces sp. NPDC059783 TaxID=3346944 RepID=UPI00365DD622
MSGTCRETVEQQAYLTRHLLDYTAAPVVGGTFLRGVVPTRDTVRIVTGASDAVAPDALTVYEVPLTDDDGDPVTAPLVLGWVRTLAAGTPPRSDEFVMGMALLRVDTSLVEPAPPTPADRVLRVLRTLAWPFTESPPSPPLCGFLLGQGDRMRLYIAVEEANGVIGVDVRLTGALTALLAALPTLVHEKERWAHDPDPHCTHTIDLTTW